jgi:lantibiotic modifying enzyme
VRLSAVPYAYRAFDPGFMQGLAGVGYQWARLSAPSAVPSVLAFQMRRSASDDRR